MEQKLGDIHRLACEATGQLVTMLVMRRTYRPGLHFSLRKLREAVKILEDLLRELEDRG